MTTTTTRMILHKKGQWFEPGKGEGRVVKQRALEDSVHTLQHFFVRQSGLRPPPIQLPVKRANIHRKKNVLMSSPLSWASHCPAPPVGHSCPVVPWLSATRPRLHVNLGTLSPPTHNPLYTQKTVTKTEICYMSEEQKGIQIISLPPSLSGQGWMQTWADCGCDDVVGFLFC